MTILAHHPLPAVQTFETDAELIVEIELPGEEPRFQAEVCGRILRVAIPRPPRHPAWEPRPDTSP